ncbi:hypothetical protein [Ectobacillus antri]|jgi:hypothetical protein|uniref:hypothetical protein n=1 Tax=Ectobacillus antri TaxID=2486280 RepID=UPI000F5A32CC|nr:hypothetical protein [Ectobacillus antri]
MKFSITANYYNMRGDLTYDNGVITGNPLLVDALIDEAGFRKGKTIGVMNYKPAGDILEDPSATRLIMELIFTDITYHGDKPELPDVDDRIIL